MKLYDQILQQELEDVQKSVISLRKDRKRHVLVSGSEEKKTSSSLLETDGIETVIKDESLTAWRAVWCHKSPGVRSTRWNGVFGDIAVCWSARTTS